MPYYRCKNYGGCPKADGRENIELPPGAPPVCPEPKCQKPLVEAPGSPGGGRAGNASARGTGTGRRPLLVGLIGAAVLLVGLLVWWRWASPDRVLSLKVEPAPTGQVGVVLEVPITVEPAEAAIIATLTAVEGGPPPGVLLDGPARILRGTPQSTGTFAVKINGHAEGYQDAFASVVFTIGGSQPPPPPPLKNGGTEYDLVLVGSNTIGGVDASSGKGLARDLVNEFFKTKGASAAVEEKLLDVGKDEKERTVTFRLAAGDTKRVLIRPHGSKTAVEALISTDPKVHGDIGMSSSHRPELQSVDFAEYVIALDAVAVIVNPENRIRELTLEEVKSIFGPDPTRTDWDDFGPIHTYGRDRKSGTTESFRAFTGIDKALESLGQKKDAPIPYSGVPSGQDGHEGYEDTQKVIDKVRNDKQAIGYVGRAANLPSDVKAVAIRAAARYPAFTPNPTTIRTMEYSMARELYLYAARNTRPLASDFIRFCLSDAGQKVANDAAFIGFSTDDLLDRNPSLGDGAPRELREKVTGYDRILISFRFKSGGDVLDTLSAQNFRLLKKFLSLPENQHRQLVIVGSVDSVGDARANVILSQRRAGKFAERLDADGVTNPVAETLGYGEDYLLYDDHGDKNSREAQRNRRVDVYLK